MRLAEADILFFSGGYYFVGRIFVFYFLRLWNLIYGRRFIFASAAAAVYIAAAMKNKQRHNKNRPHIFLPIEK